MRDQSVYFSGRTNCTVQFFLVILSVIFLSLFTLPANAQKAHYSGPQSTVVSGYGSWFPYAVAVDGSGNVYISDYGNNRVLKGTWAGSGTARRVLWGACRTPVA